MRRLALAFVWCVAAAAAMAARRYTVLFERDRPEGEVPQAVDLRGAWIPWLPKWDRAMPLFAEPIWVPTLATREGASAVIENPASCSGRDDGQFEAEAFWSANGAPVPMGNLQDCRKPCLFVREGKDGAVRAINLPKKPRESPACLFFAADGLARPTRALRGVDREDEAFLPFWLDNLLGNPSREAGVRARFADLPWEKREKAARRYSRAQWVLARERLGLGEAATPTEIVAALKARLGEVGLPPLPKTVCRFSVTNDVLTLRVANPTRQTLTVANLPGLTTRGIAPHSGVVGWTLLRLPGAWQVSQTLCLRPGEARTLRWRIAGEANQRGCRTELKCAMPVLFAGTWHALRFDHRIPGLRFRTVVPLPEDNGWRRLTLAREAPGGWRVAPMPEGLLTVRFTDCGIFAAPGLLEAETGAGEPFVLEIGEGLAPRCVPDCGIMLEPGFKTVFPDLPRAFGTDRKGRAMRTLAGMGGPVEASFDAYLLDSEARVAHPVHAARAYAPPTEEALRREWEERKPERTVRSPEAPTRLRVSGSHTYSNDTPALAPGWIAFTLRGERLTLTFTNRSPRALTVSDLPPWLDIYGESFRLDGAWLPVPGTLGASVKGNLPEAPFTLAPGAARTFRWRVKGLADDPTGKRPVFLSLCDLVALDGETFVCDLSLPLFTDNPIAIALTPCEDAPDKAGEGTSKAR